AIARPELVRSDGDDAIRPRCIGTCRGIGTFEAGRPAEEPLAGAVEEVEPPVGAIRERIYSVRVDEPDVETLERRARNLDRADAGEWRVARSGRGDTRRQSDAGERCQAGDDHGEERRAACRLHTAAILWHVGMRHLRSSS